MIRFIKEWGDKYGQAIICEYVENEEIQQFLEDIGIEYSQGFLFAKPEPFYKITRRN